MKKTFLMLLVFLAVKTYAGMPLMSITSVFELNLTAISCFIFIILIAPFFVRLIWNHSIAELTSLSKINYFVAAALVFVWAAVFYLILTMIAGGREIMTPESWERDGITYKLKSQSPSKIKHMRQKDLEKLRTALWKYVQKHKELPVNDYFSNIPKELWETIHPAKLHYSYRYGLKIDEGEHVLAYEPGAFGKYRYVLFNNGEIKYLAINKITKLIRDNPVH